MKKIIVSIVSLFIISSIDSAVTNSENIASHSKIIESKVACEVKPSLVKTESLAIVSPTTINPEYIVSKLDKRAENNLKEVITIIKKANVALLESLKSNKKRLDMDKKLFGEVDFKNLILSLEKNAIQGGLIEFELMSDFIILQKRKIRILKLRISMLDDQGEFKNAKYLYEAVLIPAQEAFLKILMEKSKALEKLSKDISEDSQLFESVKMFQSYIIDQWNITFDKTNDFIAAEEAVMKILNQFQKMLI